MIGEGANNNLCVQRAVGRYELFPAELVTSQACFVTHYLNTGVVEGTTVSKARHLSLFEFKPDTRRMALVVFTLLPGGFHFIDAKLLTSPKVPISSTPLRPRSPPLGE